MLEKPIEPETVPQIRTDVTNKTAFVQKRSDIIFQDTLTGHWEVGRHVGDRVLMLTFACSNDGSLAFKGGEGSTLLSLQETYALFDRTESGATSRSPCFLYYIISPLYLLRRMFRPVLDSHIQLRSVPPWVVPESRPRLCLLSLELAEEFVISTARIGGTKRWLSPFTCIVSTL
jgi:hypothetical protein